MAITYGFFNSLNEDRKYNADQMTTYFEGLVSDGVYESIGGAFQVVANSGMTVNVRTGRALIRSRWVKSDAIETLTISAAHATLNRITAVVLRLDLSARTITLTTKNGTNATTPTAPAMEDTTTVKEICLARIYVGKGVTAISQSNITDTRANTNVCGWVTGIIEQVDTSELFLQWQTAYEEFYDEMRSWMTTEKAAFDAWMQTVTQEFTIGAYIQAYVCNLSSYTPSGAILLRSLTFSQAYTPENTDVISIYINGLRAQEGTDYTLSGSGTNRAVTFANSVKYESIRIEALKAVLGVSSNS